MSRLTTSPNIRMKQFHVYMLTAYFKQKRFGGIRIESHRKLLRKYNRSCRSFFARLPLGVVSPDGPLYGNIPIAPACVHMHIQQGKGEVCPVIQADIQEDGITDAVRLHNGPGRRLDPQPV